MRLKACERIVLQGERLPPKESGHPDRRAITVKGQEIDLQDKNWSYINGNKRRICY